MLFIKCSYLSSDQHLPAGGDVIHNVHDDENAVPMTSMGDKINKSRDAVRLGNINVSLLTERVQTTTADGKRSVKIDAKLTKTHIRILRKRWSRMMFACHCTRFHIGCHSNDYCSRRYGYDFKCRRDCCGTLCMKH